jgi:hypothetical protein
VIAQLGRRKSTFAIASVSTAAWGVLASMHFWAKNLETVDDDVG